MTYVELRYKRLQRWLQYILAFARNASRKIETKKKRYLESPSKAEKKDPNTVIAHSLMLLCQSIKFGFLDAPSV